MKYTNPISTVLSYLIHAWDYFKFALQNLIMAGNIYALEFLYS